MILEEVKASVGRGYLKAEVFRFPPAPEHPGNLQPAPGPGEAPGTLMQPAASIGFYLDAHLASSG